MQLSEKKTYRTRDGSRTGIRVLRFSAVQNGLGGTWYERGTLPRPIWYGTGALSCTREKPGDLIEETSALDPRPFSYDACPTGPDGRRRAVTRDGHEVVLLCDDAPGTAPIKGYLKKTGQSIWRQANGRLQASNFDDDEDLLVPPPPKQVAWFNLWPNGSWTRWNTQMQADCQEGNYPVGIRLGGCAHPVEVDDGDEL